MYPLRCGSQFSFQRGRDAGSHPFESRQPIIKTVSQLCHIPPETPVKPRDFTGTFRCTSLLREVVEGNCVGASSCVSLSVEESLSKRVPSAMSPSMPPGRSASAGATVVAPTQKPELGMARNGSGDRCVFSNVGSAILSAHAGANERSATSPDDCIEQVVCDAVIEEGRRSKKPSPCHVFLPFSEPI
jgi:hypothetical protein